MQQTAQLSLLCFFFFLHKFQKLYGDFMDTVYLVLLILKTRSMKFFCRFRAIQVTSSPPTIAGLRVILLTTFDLLAPTKLNY